MSTRGLPFATNVVNDVGAQPATTTLSGPFAPLLPAAYRNRDDDIAAPRAEERAFLEQELLLPLLAGIEPWLWVCGRPMPPRPLHRQVMMGREIVITEDTGMHLVWTKNRIFVKPMPAYLLSLDFWRAHLVGSDDLAAHARGFLFVYVALIMHPSDFCIARDAGLLPAGVEWPHWQRFCAEVLARHDFGAVSPRYWYGELRLGRLNKVCAFARGALLRGYSSIGGYAAYGEMVGDNLATVATGLGYVVIVLTAMQVGLATSELGQSSAFQSASYGFTVFSILAPLGAAVMILAAVGIRLVVNWAATAGYERRRLSVMNVTPRWKPGGRPSH